jgi:hypothetical protein
MKTSLEYDKEKKKFAPKTADLFAFLKSGEELGCLQLNLSDYSVPDTYKEQFFFQSKVDYISS